MAETANTKSPRYRSFRELTVWQHAMELALEIHSVAKTLPDGQRYEIARDLRRTARSIPSNVAEGFNRHSRATYRHHIAIALGSQAELETQVELAYRLDFLDSERADKLQERIATVGRLLHGLWRALGPDGTKQVIA